MSTHNYFTQPDNTFFFCLTRYVGVYSSYKHVDCINYIACKILQKFDDFLFEEVCEINQMTSLIFRTRVLSRQIITISSR